VLGYRVKLTLRGSGMLCVISTTQPVVRALDGGAIASVDTLGYVDWPDVSALALRPARISLGDAASPRADWRP
jgi:hypothetical protein